MNDVERGASHFCEGDSTLDLEIALDPEIPTFAGGLGVLAGDSLRSAADLGVPMVGVSLLYRKGYFRQRLDGSGNQPMFYGRPSAYAQVMQYAIAVNGSFFNTQRMGSQYLANAYRSKSGT